MTMQFPFDNSYARLPARFFAAVAPTAVPAPRLLQLNRGLALELGLDPDWLASREGIETLAGSRIPDDAQPLAAAYAGHQFGSFVPQLGDGRAILLGEVIDRAGKRRDIQLKGAGPTPFSRQGDGRAAIGPVLREYIVSEAMAALGIPTTRSLAAVATGDTVFREAALPGAVLTRVASSHIRVGTFQFFAARQDVEALRLLADHVIARHDPEAAGADRPYRALLDGVIARQAKLVASWLSVGFIHGVMNTDNMSVAGETIDYGPCAFLDAYHPGKVFSSIDRAGRYAYANQPRIAHWNLARLAECLMPLLDPDQETGLREAQQSLAAFPDLFESAFQDGLRRKLGLVSSEKDDAALARALLNAMAANEADFTLTFRRLCDAAIDPAADATVKVLFRDPDAYGAWAVQWRLRVDRDEPSPDRRSAMRAVNPAIVPRNHRIEAAIRAAVERDDLGPAEHLIAGLARPFEDRAGFEDLALPPKADELVRETFCGT